MNSRHEETMKAHDGHSTYESTGTSTDSIKELSVIKSCDVQIQETKRSAANITVNSVSIHSQYKNSGNKNNKEYNHQVNTYN